MKSKESLLSKMYALLTELEYGFRNSALRDKLKAKLEFLYLEVLDEEDIPEEYWERIETIIEE